MRKSNPNRPNLKFAILILIGLLLWFFPKPAEVSRDAWHLFALFVATIVGVVLRPFPMGAVAILALTLSIATQTLDISAAMSGFNNEIVWLVMFAFFISKGFMATGLGLRIAYKIMDLFGRHCLSLGYGLVLTDLVLAPTIPSVTARIGGVIYPILKSVAEVFTGNFHDPRVGAFLTQATFQGSMITSAMFITSMAGNLLVVEFARAQGIEITWGSWMIAGIVPGLLSLLSVPFLIYLLTKPLIRSTPHVRMMAKEKQKSLGKVKAKEWIMIGAFCLLIVLWIFGPLLAIKATTAAMIGFSILIAARIVDWKDVLEEKGAWDTFVWFATLITFATHLNKLGFTDWFSKQIIFQVNGMDWMWGFAIISLIYFYSHYLFVSCLAHVSAMYACFLIIALAIGTPPMIAALVLGFFSSLMGALTHYGTGQAPILFAMGYMSTAEWWKIGFLSSLVNIAIWIGIGSLWWRFLGIW